MVVNQAAQLFRVDICENMPLRITYLIETILTSSNLSWFGSCLTYFHMLK